MNPNANNTGRVSDQVDGAVEKTSILAVPSSVKAALASVMLIAPGALTPQQAAAQSAQELQSELVHPVVSAESESSYSATDMISRVDERYHDAINDMSAEYIDAMNPVFSMVMGITDEKDRERAVRRVINFFESPEEDSFVQMMERLPRYGVTLSEALVSDLTVFYIAEQTRFGTEIDQTLLAIADIDQMTATMKAQNLIRQRRIEEIEAEVTLLLSDAETRLSDAETRLSDAETRLSDAETRLSDTEARLHVLESEILRLRALQESTEQVIRDLESRPSAA